ncbi:hypothetical protein NL676_031415 [Syzygium grande]|nr:hypothetical protein NL676_031415 [Syzygium grande]
MASGEIFVQKPPFCAVYRGRGWASTFQNSAIALTCAGKEIGNAAKMSMELAKGLLDIVRQTLGNENSFLVKYFGRNSYIVGRPQGPCARASVRLERLNEYLPEYKDPTHV